MIVAEYKCQECDNELVVCFLSGKPLQEVQCDCCWRRSAVLVFVYEIKS